MKLKSALFALCAGLILALPALAQGMKMDQHDRSNMMMQDLGPSDTKYDLRFLNAMIMHHEGALVMANDALKKSKRPEIQALAKDIIAAQQKEIAQMKLWRKTWYQQ